MRTLFFKIFASFWLAIVLVVAVLVVFGLIDQSPVNHQDRIRALFENLISVNGSSVVEAWIRGQSAEAHAALDRLHATFGMKGALFDELGKHLCGEARLAEYIELARRAGRSGRFELADEVFHPTGALAIRGGDGRYYVVVSQMLPPPIPEVLDRPSSLLWRLLAVIVMVMAVCYVLARYVSGPIGRLREAARKLAEGDWSARVGGNALKRRDEVGDLARDFEFMAEQLDHLAASQRRLLRDISHELRSPLSRLQVALELARRNSDASVHPSLDRIRRESDRMEHLISQLLTLARLESEGLTTESVAVELEGLVREIAADADFEGALRGCRVTVFNSRPCFAHGSPALLRSAIENVIRNAVAFTTHGQAVEVRQSRSSGDAAPRVVIEVRDHGPGVPEASLSSIFQPFYRVDDARVRETGGVGLGLAITERIIRSHGGAVSAENADGGGLLVRIELPAVDSIPAREV